MNVIEVIGRKRDGLEQSAEEIRFLLDGYLAGSVRDYQVAAWLMAVVIRGMTRAETLALTQAMVDSGEVMDLSEVPGFKVDKHSTGGVGDKVTLIAGPLAAACGVPVPKLSGRALAHTGGTLDKLESVPGLRVELTPEEFRAQVREVGLAVAAQSPRMVPADKALYALRDVTATVASVPLIASSVMSKKLAAGADGIVLDVKEGRGAFMPDLESATSLARLMVEIGEGAGRRTVALVTAMDNPLGRTVGNALEVGEALEVLAGGGDAELREVSIRVAAEMCRLAGVGRDPAQAIADGSALDRFRRMLAAQGGRLEEGLPVARVQVPLQAASGGWIEAIDALEVGYGSLELGAGRLRKEDPIDHSAGIVIERQVGDRVEAGEALAVIHTRTLELADRARPRLQAAWRIADHEVQRPPHVLERVAR
ncbi:MAG: thymidine phosphorylase [Chloroflexi bacterium]|nr:MAG: thymidine phosphorylase [Chloroflexota bacterium]